MAARFDAKNTVICELHLDGVLLEPSTKVGFD